MKTWKEFLRFLCLMSVFKGQKSDHKVPHQVYLQHSITQLKTVIQFWCKIIAVCHQREKLTFFFSLEGKISGRICLFERKIFFFHFPHVYTHKSTTKRIGNFHCQGLFYAFRSLKPARAISFMPKLVFPFEVSRKPSGKLIDHKHFPRCILQKIFDLFGGIWEKASFVCAAIARGWKIQGLTKSKEIGKTFIHEFCAIKVREKPRNLWNYSWSPAFFPWLSWLYRQMSSKIFPPRAKFFSRVAASSIFPVWYLALWKLFFFSMKTKRFSKRIFFHLFIKTSLNNFPR